MTLPFLANLVAITILVFALEADGSVLASFTVAKPLQSLVHSSAALVAGESYDLYAGADASGDSVAGLTGSGSTSGADLVTTLTAAGA